MTNFELAKKLLSNYNPSTTVVKNRINDCLTWVELDRLMVEFGGDYLKYYNYIMVSFRGVDGQFLIVELKIS